MEIENYTGYGRFADKLKTGNRLENYLCEKLKKRGLDVRLTEQTPGKREEELSNIDVIIYRDNRPVLGIECKLNIQPFRICPWSDTNVPLNECSLKTYLKAKFPVYILAGQVWTKELYFEGLEGVLKSKYMPQNTCYKDTYINNYDAGCWYHTKRFGELVDHIIDLIDKEK